MSDEEAVDWVCDYCGEQGTSTTDLTVDSIQCPQCGEPVIPR